uniref:Tumor necrosis factor ligand superfamily member 4 n=1 Tax=Callithrix jacchus TaxID=9483 RepID=A0A2R8P0Q4_CALJA
MVPHQYPRIQSIKVQFTEYKKEKGFILTSQKEDEMMKLQNNSIVINCDGFYLISLKGYFSQNISISLHYQEHEEPLFQLEKVRSVNSLMVASLTYKDKVYLNVTTDSTSLDDFYVNGGELILIHQNPGEYCVP